MDTSDDEIFITPPSSPVMQPFEGDETLDLAVWKLNIFDEELKKLVAKRKDCDLELKRCMALLSAFKTKTGRRYTKTSTNPPTASSRPNKQQQTLRKRTQSKITKKEAAVKTTTVNTTTPVKSRPVDITQFKPRLPDMKISNDATMNSVLNIDFDKGKNKKNNISNNENNHGNIITSESSHTTFNKKIEGTEEHTLPSSSSTPSTIDQQQKEEKKTEQILEYQKLPQEMDSLNRPNISVISSNVPKKPDTTNPATLSRLNNRPHQPMAFHNQIPTRPSSSWKPMNDTMHTPMNQHIYPASVSFPNGSRTTQPIHYPRDTRSSVFTNNSGSHFVPSLQQPQQQRNYPKIFNRANIPSKPSSVTTTKSQLNKPASVEISPGDSSIKQPPVPKKTSHYQSTLKSLGISNMDWMDSDLSTSTTTTTTSGPEQTADTSRRLCVFEANGGTCNDDTCMSQHFRDFR
ncbi:uncharacterized protein BX664DRAFT_386010 [Halteromyces radiatus]|uniref:uncharacterized protein n=1 Tax=Halteromyces radiatus TaxID=101107 RepID=UPI00221ED551|nr:uncharacterized protein BX664DRAFT_386010 [Halteromyces radiatus]KAI8089534.1 hypothetical protein BX664DRAFT_386010 [Halteromyces radiatus]